MTRLMPYMVAFIAALVGFLFYQSRTSMSTIENQQDSVIYAPPRFDETKEKRSRVSIGASPGALVKGWPSKGGIYILEDCFGIELDFLKLDRFHSQPSPSGPDAAAEEEEAHCNRMRQLGAVWWESKEQWFLQKLMEPNEPSLRRRQRFVKVGWPVGGGVWVIDITVDDASTRHAGIIYNAHDMEERCRLIEQLGGVFYENPKDWLDVDLP
ncbi:hypothetical protein BBK36DRAFT_1204443 [Trichoderma citrinoviride]|uniref:Uncharacterized protein n=1 Tax=Trichoderma citrinoviride TaxID=58853 RepID=A0A2T4B7C2_9HYPO|nr:hypothetical protein BBK36DRAFT_1204443 [Trichoderma citrinoviride]PTB65188.1 hypothetical protein BBK36DRAFT_1204443 [Trichoderma citrinoviride]